jgi:hypothetical protein
MHFTRCAKEALRARLFHRSRIHHTLRASCLPGLGPAWDTTRKCGHNPNERARAARACAPAHRARLQHTYAPTLARRRSLHPQAVKRARRVANHIFLFLSEPGHSREARLLSLAMGAVVLLSTVAFVLSSVQVGSVRSGSRVCHPRGHAFEGVAALLQQRSSPGTHWRMQAQARRPRTYGDFRATLYS